MAFPPVAQAYLIEQFPDDDVGGAFGLSRTGYVLVGSLGPTLVGLGSETVGYDATFAAFGVGLVGASVLLALFVPESLPRGGIRPRIRTPARRPTPTGKRGTRRRSDGTGGDAPKFLSRPAESGRA